jgi:hypothetical protein
VNERIFRFEAKAATAESLRAKARKDVTEAIMRAAMLEHKFAQPAEYEVRSQGDCMPDSLALSEFKGTPAQWLLERAEMSKAMRSRVHDWLGGKEHLEVTVGVLCICCRNCHSIFFALFRPGDFPCPPSTTPT